MIIQERFPTISEGLKELVGFNKKKEVITTSRKVAEYFGKDHKNVLSKIRSFENLPDNFTGLNFKLSEYIDPTGRKLPEYEITKDGFTFLVMGFTGSNADKFKINYIKAFNYYKECYDSYKYQKENTALQIATMDAIHDMLPEEEKKDKVNYIKANTIVNKAISNFYGLPKSLKKDQMSSDMLNLRDKALNQYVSLFDFFEGDTSKVKEMLYTKYQQPQLENK